MVRLQKRLKGETRKNSDMKRECPMLGPCWWDAACQATSVGVYKGMGEMGPVMDRKRKDVVVQADVSLW